MTRLISGEAPIRIVRLAHMRYRHANLAEAKDFLEAFGLRLAYTVDGTLYFAGEGPDPYVYVAEQVSLARFAFHLTG